jgi:hypothetical protein
MGDIPPLTQFSESIKWLIQRNTRFGGTGVVQRCKVEEIGANLGMSKVAACQQFLSLQGSLWDVYTSSMDISMTKSAATRHLEPARSNDVTVLGGL